MRGPWLFSALAVLAPAYLAWVVASMALQRLRWWRL
jgi:hypothetical protein